LVRLAGLRRSSGLPAVSTCPVVASISTHDAASIAGGVTGNGISSACASEAQKTVTVINRRLFNTSSLVAQIKQTGTAGRFTAKALRRFN
jgi:hypothetical protein